MTDRFKFRVWDKKFKRFDIHYPIYSYYIGMDGLLYEYISEIDETSSIIKCDTSRFVLQQCTGLIDKKENLIYEGDILAKKNTIWIVEFFPEVFCKSCNANRTSGFQMKSPSHSTIIGNIFENPELLEKI